MTGIKPNFSDWRQLSAIEIWEAAVLMQGFDPKAVALGDVAVRDPNYPTSTNGVHPDTSWEKRALISAVSAGELLGMPGSAAGPNDHTEILKKSLIPWLRSLGKYDDLANGLDGIAQNQPAKQLVAASANDDDDLWKTRARQEAKEIVKRQRTRDLYPSQSEIADEIARNFRTEGVAGQSGKPMSGAYIKRHALKGISSAQGKQVSTSKSRGK